jgi:hypothetical protein
MNQRLSDALLGGVAGVIGASGMTVVRMLAHRAGLIDQMVPQAIEQGVERRTGRPDNPGVSRAADQALHLGYGLVMGALYSAVVSRPRRRHRAVRSAAYGLAHWAFGSMALLPGLRVARPAWRRGAAQNAVDIAAHVVYAEIASFVAGELARQEEVSPRAGHPSSPARVG